MNLLLDSHAFLWWCADSPTLGQAARDAIAAPANRVHLSAASVWEIGIKAALGRLDIPEPPSRAAARNGFSPLAITFAHAEAAAALPPHHRDPFDRLLIAQAMGEGLVLVTRDAVFGAYGVAVLPV
jgi:PIN domain nuclease of toxin-antitoxin system